MRRERSGVPRATNDAPHSPEPRRKGRALIAKSDVRRKLRGQLGPVLGAVLGRGFAGGSLKCAAMMVVSGA